MGNSSLFGGITEETPRYKLFKKGDTYEIREYESQLRAEVDVPGSELTSSGGFNALAGYIFGGNTSGSSIEMTAPVTTEKSEKIAMTAPVTTTTSGEFTTMSFILPSKYKELKDLPTPKNKNVRLVKDEPKQLAVMTWNGAWDEETCKEKEKMLKETLKRDNVEILNPNPTLFRYNPPWTLWWMRTNEIALKVLAKL